jgi:hypothetical protein
MLWGGFYYRELTLPYTLLGFTMDTLHLYEIQVHVACGVYYIIERS